MTIHTVLRSVAQKQMNTAQLQREATLTFSRSAGPGGQNVNKLNTKVTLRWHPASSQVIPESKRDLFFRRASKKLTKEGELLIVSQRYRDQKRNIEDCLQKLEDFIERATKPVKKRKPTRPSRAAKERRLQEKQRRGTLKRRRGAKFAADDD